MKDNLSILSSVAVIAIVAYAAYLLSAVDTASINNVNTTLKKISDSLNVGNFGGAAGDQTGTATAKTDPTKMVLYSGIAVLLVSSIYILYKGKR